MLHCASEGLHGEFFPYALQKGGPLPLNSSTLSPRPSLHDSHGDNHILHTDELKKTVQQPGYFDEIRPLLWVTPIAPQLVKWLEHFASMAFDCLIRRDHGPSTEESSDSGLVAAFHGCIDWHSAVHAHWAVLRVARALRQSDALSDDIRRMATTLERTLTSERVDKDTLEGLRRYRSFELPYGRAWLLLLVRETAVWHHEEHGGPDESLVWLFKLGDEVFDELRQHYSSPAHSEASELSFLQVGAAARRLHAKENDANPSTPRRHHPVEASDIDAGRVLDVIRRYRVSHSPTQDSPAYHNDAWALLQLLEYARFRQQPPHDILALIEKRFPSPPTYVPSAEHEASGFFSPFWSQCYLWAHALDISAPVFLQALDQISDATLEVPRVNQTGANGHNLGRVWSRAWAMVKTAAAAAHIGETARKVGARTREAAASHVIVGLKQRFMVAGGGGDEAYMQYGHWVPQFSVLALTEGLGDTSS
ncbi:unnamed protein product [Vitrella brassicaformis CCMP3155]|uniref:Uncharacterized protein n=1 Tax=Vitrella brassicaformis (strain CCMP3155) TaxID=1169540 RepID=A0A0G4G1U6_VITBC|nr:unnamed protein product [Vitrella brassicaformis CCMP3155]|eukprot:CEM22016.1 unnamed protein product [Vitrella brassicaformis CCMP3155]